MKTLAIFLIAVATVWFRQTAYAQQFLKLDNTARPPAVSTAQVAQTTAQEIKPVKQAEIAPQANPPATEPEPQTPAPANCTADQWVRADNGQCIDKPKPAQAAPVAQATQPVRTTAASSGYCGDNQYKQYIYSHESGCQTDRWNSSGCYGIGQACPASKIAYCGADFACQDAWFSNYAVSKYGSWEKAYYFWLNNHWW